MDEVTKDSKGKQKRIYVEIAIIVAAAVVIYIFVFILREQNILDGWLSSIQHMAEITAAAITILLGSIVFAVQRQQELAAELKKTIKTEDTLGELEKNYKQTIELLQQATEEAVKHSREEKQRNSELTTINRMAELVQTGNTEAEISNIAAQTMKQLFPEHSGTLFLYNATRDVLNVAFTWGNNPFTEQHVTTRECHVLQRGQPFVSTRSDEIHCNMAENSSGNPYSCIPLIAHEEILGVLTMIIEGPDAKQVIETCTQLALSTCDIIAVSLANIRLRESLRNLSIRDPLTGLFNRRYMDELLDIESRRSKRKGSPIGIIMLDIDNFKDFNDIFGHEAGDVILKKIGGFVQGAIRDSDIACRYGGDEFAIIMPEASLETTNNRAELLRTTVKALVVKYEGHTLDTIRLSLGVAAFPSHGIAIYDVVLAADAALFAAKRSGRDCVCLAPPKE